MSLVPLLKVDRPLVISAGGQPRAATDDERLVTLSSWMMVLGTVRLVCTFADYATAFLNAYRIEPISSRMLGKFLEENQPVLLLSSAWPLLIGMAIRRTRWPALLLAAGLTFLILPVGGLLNVVAGWNQSLSEGVALGPIHLTRRALLHPTLSDLTLGILGAAQLFFEFATALRSFQLAHFLRGPRGHLRDVVRHEAARRARFGRLAVYAALGFLALTIRLPVWTTYLEIINDSRLIREFVLKNDTNRSTSPQRVVRWSPEQAEVKDFHFLLGLGYGATRTTHYLDAKESYTRLIARAKASGDQKLAAGTIAVVAEAENNLAWLLATCPKTEIRDPKEALEHARQAIKLEPRQANFWNTLGVACYRNGLWNEAKDALHKAMEIRGEGDSFDWFFLALTELKQGHKAESMVWFEKAVSWHHQIKPDDEELRHFHLEAAEALGVSAPTTRRHPDPGPRSPAPSPPAS
jgi:tetratricopeptide (TPR) repeat protein